MDAAQSAIHHINRKPYLHLGIIPKITIESKVGWGQWSCFHRRLPRIFANVLSISCVILSLQAARLDDVSHPQFNLEPENKRNYETNMMLSNLSIHWNIKFASTNCKGSTYVLQTPVLSALSGFGTEAFWRYPTTPVLGTCLRTCVIHIFHIFLISSTQPKQPF